MLSIRAEQMRAFKTAAETAFLRGLVRHLRENHAEEEVVTPAGEFRVEELDDETLLRMAGAGVERARRYGMSWESSLTAFVVLMFVVAPNFDEHPLIRRVLGDEQVAPDLRLDGLWEQTTEENWEAAENNYDPGAWERLPGGGE